MTFIARAASVADYPVFVRLFPELGVEDPLLTEEQFASRILPHAVILDDGERLGIGYAAFRLYGATAHVAHVIVDPEARGKKAGRALMDEVRRHALEAGCTRWYLNVKQDNVPALRLYEGCGLVVEQEAWATTTAWSRLATLTGTSDAHAFVPSPSDDASLTAAFGVDGERIALFRSRVGVVLMALREGDSPVAFAAFDPSFPGIYPVHVARTELAKPLFEALRPHAKQDRVAVTIEGGRALYELILSVGAHVDHVLYRMGAPLHA